MPPSGGRSWDRALAFREHQHRCGVRSCWSVALRCHVTAHSLTHEGERRRSPDRRGSRNGLLHLGWSHFWLLISILGGMLTLVVLVFFAHLSSR
jgi:hypothetical protein